MYIKEWSAGAPALRSIWVYKYLGIRLVIEPPPPSPRQPPEIHYKIKVLSTHKEARAFQLNVTAKARVCCCPGLIHCGQVRKYKRSVLKSRTSLDILSSARRTRLMFISLTHHIPHIVVNWNLKPRKTKLLKLSHILVYVYIYFRTKQIR